jgi:hypothetical protein
MLPMLHAKRGRWSIHKVNMTVSLAFLAPISKPSITRRPAKGDQP